MNPSPIAALSDLNRCRTAPTLSANEQNALQDELIEAMKPFTWFTAGVMASSSTEAITCVRELESAMGWPAMRLENDIALDRGVFLKANQSTGLIRLRAEAGLGEGILLSGHQAENHEPGPTWGPFPLNFFQSFNVP